MTSEDPSSEDSATGLPIVRTWRAAYLFTLAFFVICVALLVALSGANP